MSRIADGYYAFDNDLNSVLAALEGTFVETGGLVKQHGTPQMKVVMEVVVYYINEAIVSKAETEVVITAADATQPRKDIIVGDSAGNITAVAGTKANAAPVGGTGPQTYQPKPPDIPDNKVLLAEVWVEASEATILDADITDRRVERGFVPVEQDIELFLPAYGSVEAAPTAPASFDDYSTVRCPDDENSIVYFSFRLPRNFVSLVSIEAVWVTLAAAGNMYWKLGVSYGSVGEDPAEHIEHPGFGVTATGGATEWNVQEPDTPLTLGSVVLDDYIGIHFYRDGDHASDTLGDFVDIVGLLFTYRGVVGRAGGEPHAASHQDGGDDEVSVVALSGLLADDQHILDVEVLAVAAALVHKTRHQDGGDDEITLAGLSGLAADDQHVLDAEVLAVAAALVHKARHISGGADELTATDLLEAIVKRIQTSTGPTTLTVGAIAIGEYVKRVGATLVGGTPAGAAAGEGHITILPLSYNSIGQGTWVISIDTAQFLNGNVYNSTAADGDNISYKVYLDAGTYTLRMLVKTQSSAGIVDVDIDAAEVASFDLYSGATTRNVVKTQTNIVIGSAGLKTLKLRADGKNGSSSGYYILPQYIALWRTA